MRFTAKQAGIDIDDCFNPILNWMKSPLGILGLSGADLLFFAFNNFYSSLTPAFLRSSNWLFLIV